MRFTTRFMDPTRIPVKPWQLQLRKRRLGLADPVSPQDPSALSAGCFSFLGRSVSFQKYPDWSAAGFSRLWQYNLHYFDWLWSLLPETKADWESAKRLTQNWIDQHPVGKGACGWEPYPTSLRLINWCLLFGVRHRPRLEYDDGFCQQLLQSIGRQVGWLEKNLETHIHANHLLENLCAITCVTSVLEGYDRERLSNWVRPLLKVELDEQMLADGMHYERSPMYHLRIMWLLEMLQQVGDKDIRGMVEKPLSRARMALSMLRHPDQDIAQFNDAAIGIYQDLWPDTSEDGAWALPDAGYYGYRSGGDYLIADCGPIGPDHQPGHAHADFLSFELSLEGQRVITDTGVGTYDVGPQRSHDRSTAAHNTVEIVGQNSAEVWGSFRVGRRSVPRVLQWKPQKNGMLLEAEHHGYRHLQGSPLHRRVFEWTDKELWIRDTVMSRQSHEMAVRFHLSPGVEATIQGDELHGRINDLEFILTAQGPGDMKLERSLAFPRFGEDEERLVLVLRHRIDPPMSEWVFHIQKVKLGCPTDLC